MPEEFIAHYKLTGKLGAGGMGEVYRATDTKLDRQVAIKLLPSSFTDDKERVARFEREAKVLASLNHSNIAAIYGLEKSENSHALVLELVEGETLAERLIKGPLPVEEALEVCRQIAEALEAAHDKGIIHRDLKPGNVKLTQGDTVKVLDFGLAKALSEDQPTELAAGQTDSPTITDHYTKPGTILGTAAYMSPEQARGKPVDKRTDIWSFGCVLYECLTGKCLFKGEDVTQTLAMIIEREPDWSTLPENTPPTIHLLLRKCLTKDRKRRLHDIADGRVDLEQGLADPSSTFIRLTDEALIRERSRETHLVDKSKLVLLGALLGGFLIWLLKPTSAPSNHAPKHTDLVVRSDKPFTTIRANNAFAISNDGNLLVYNLDDLGKGLRLRDLGTGQERPIPGAATYQEGHPFFSSDGSRIGFVADDKLVSISVSGGTSRILWESGTTYQGFLGADWSQKGEIVFAQEGYPLRLISEGGGRPKELTKLTENEHHFSPQFLDDGDWVAFVSKERGATGGIQLVNTTTFETKSLGGEIECDDIRFAPSGHLLLTLRREVYAVALDLDRMEGKGKPTPVLGERVFAGDSPWNRAQFDVAADGTLVFLPANSMGLGGQKTLAWIDTDGRIERFTQHQGLWNRFDLSPDERRVVLEIEEDIWVLEAQDGAPPRPLVRHAAAVDRNPLWSADGEWVFFYSNRNDRHGIWRKKATFPGPPAELVGESEWLIYPGAVSSNFVMMAQYDGPEGSWDIMRFDLNGENAVLEPFMNDESDNEIWHKISPDERWVVYDSDETGRRDVFLASIDGAGSRMLSREGANMPQWSGDGGEVYWAWGQRIYSVRLVEENGQLEPEPPQEVLLAPEPLAGGGWTISSDGKRALVLVDTDIALSGPRGNLNNLKVITNWFTELNKLVPLDD